MNTNIGPWVPLSFVQHLSYYVEKLDKIGKRVYTSIKNLEGEKSRERLKDMKEIRVRNISYWDP